MNVCWLHPAPYCPLPLSHAARAYYSVDNTDVARTISEHSHLSAGHRKKEWGTQMIPEILPDVIVPRWGFALALPSIARWRSLSVMCADAAMTQYIERGDTPMHADLCFLADIAYQHMVDQQPRRRAADNFTLEEAA